MTKIVFFDIDGTLVSFTTHRIPQSTIEAIKELKAHGIKVVIATGRPKVFITNLTELEELGLIDGFVTMNGSYCYVGDKVIFSNPIPHNEAVAIGEFCEKHKYTCVFIGENQDLVRNVNNDFVELFYDMLKVKEIPVSQTFEEAISFPLYQITAFFSSAVENEIIDSLPNCEFGRWMDGFADIGAKGNTKQLGIDKMIEHFGFDLSETMAFGDGGNDITMLRHASIGVAMGGSAEEVTSAANYTTTSVDDNGIANALRHFGVI